MSPDCRSVWRYQLILQCCLWEWSYWTLLHCIYVQDQWSRRGRRDDVQLHEKVCSIFSPCLLLEVNRTFFNYSTITRNFPYLLVLYLYPCIKMIVLEHNPCFADLPNQHSQCWVCCMVKSVANDAQPMWNLKKKVLVRRSRAGHDLVYVPNLWVLYYSCVLQTEGFRSFTFTVMQWGEGEVEEIASLSVHYRIAVGTGAAGEFTSKHH